jgi:uncharacterized protein YgiM (DUF1202 family)
MRVLPSLALALTLATGTSLPAAADSTATVLEASVLHDGPAARFRRLGVIERNQQATVKTCNKSGRWCQIEAGDKQGWVMSSHLKITDTASAPAEKPQNGRSAEKPPTSSPVEAKTEAPPSVLVETEKAGKSDKLAAPGKPVIIVIRSADGKVSSTMTVAAGSNVVVTASGRSRCELKAAVNP